MSGIGYAVRDPKQSVEWGSTLEEAFLAAKSAWPRIRLSYEQFRDFVTQEGHSEITVPAYPADVYLCTACMIGEGAAHRALENSYFPSVRAAILRVVGEKAVIDDILQEIRTRLFVGLVGQAPKITKYRGSGSLSGWLRKVAVRASYDYRREMTTQRQRNYKLAHEAGANPSHQGAEERASKANVEVCERAWTHALLSLPTMERQLLHHYFVSGLSIDTLGPIYSVHRATIARRIRRALVCLRQRSRKALAQHLPDYAARDLDALLLEACREHDLSTALNSGVLSARN